MLDLECFAYLNRALESSISPIVILASNRGQTTIRGTDNLISAHGIPPDLLSRLLIVPTHPYTGPEIRQIVSTRARLEFGPVGITGASDKAQGVEKPVQGMTLSEDALDEITRQGEKVSLRYALQLLAPAGILSRCRGVDGGVVEGEDVNEAVGLFWDAGRSAGVLRHPDTSGGFIC